MLRTLRTQPAIFICPDATYHADNCEPLDRAVQRGEIQMAALCRRGYPGRPFPKNLFPEISTVGFWDAVKNQTWGLDWHRNEGIELTYLARGKADFAVDGKPYALESGHLTITRPWQQHRVGNPQIHASRLHWLILDVGVRRPDQTWRWPDWLILAPADLRRLTTLLRHNEQPVWHANPALESCFEKLAALVVHPDPTTIQTRMQLTLNELFIVLYELLQEKNFALNAQLSTTRRSVEMFLTALPNHLEHPWTLEDMAHECGLGRSRFAYYCRQITNLSPADYLSQCRVEAASQLLKAQPKLSITEAAMACGFQSSQYFATVFRKKTGQTPREYRHGRPD